MIIRNSACLLAALFPVAGMSAHAGSQTTEGDPPPPTDPTMPRIAQYVNCDGSTKMPVINILDFQCYLKKAMQADPYANCDGSTTRPFITANDFMCFLNAYAVAAEWQRGVMGD